MEMLKCEKIWGKDDYAGFELKQGNVIIRDVKVRYVLANNDNPNGYYKESDDPKEGEKNVDLMFPLKYDKKDYNKNVVLLYNEIIMFAGVEEKGNNICYHVWGYMSREDKENFKLQDGNRNKVSIMTILASIFRKNGDYKGSISNERQIFVAIHDYWRVFEAKGLQGECPYTYATFPIGWTNNENVKSLKRVLYLVAPEKQYDLQAMEYELKSIDDYIRPRLIDNLVRLYDSGEEVNYFKEFVDKAKEMKVKNNTNYLDKLVVFAYETLGMAELRYRQSIANQLDELIGVRNLYGTFMETMLKLLVVRELSIDEISEEFEISEKNKIDDIKDCTKKTVIKDKDLIRKYNNINIFLNKLSSIETEGKEAVDGYFTIGSFTYCAKDKLKCNDSSENNIINGKSYGTGIKNIINKRLGDKDYNNIKSQLIRVAEIRNNDSHTNVDIISEEIREMREIILGEAVLFEKSYLDDAQIKWLTIKTRGTSLLWMLLMCNWDDIKKELN